MKSSDIQYRVYYRDSDAGGVMYYSRYADLFEMGRTELFRDYGLSVRALQKQGTVFPVKKLQIEYLKPAFLDDLLLLTTTLVKLGGATIDCEYTLSRLDDKQILATGKTTNVSVRLETMRPTRLPKIILQVTQSD